MSTNRRPSRFNRVFVAVAAVALLGVFADVVVATPAHADGPANANAQAQAEAHLRATYPMGAPSTATFAGVDIAQLALPSLHLKTRDDRTPERGGITLSFADDRGEVHAVVRLAVARDSAGARAFVTNILRGVSGVLSPSALDEVAFADEAGRGDRFVVAARGNVAYAIDALDGTTTASTIAAVVKKTISPGAPAFPQAKLALPASINRADARGVLVTMTMSPGATYRVHATGAYVTHGRGGALVHPFAAGPVEVTAVVVDTLARVTEVRASSTAR